MTDALPSGLALSEFSSGIRPQDDLYRHVNGAWLDRTEIPGDKARWGSFHQLAEQAEKDVRAIIEESQDAEAGTLNRKVGDLFTSFMDTERIAALGLAPLNEQLAKVDAVDSIRSFLATVGTVDRDGVAALIGVFIEPEPGNPERYVPFAVQAGLSLPDESYYRQESFEGTRAAYRAHLERILTLAGVADAAATADRAFGLEHEIAGHHWDNVASRDAVKTYNLKTWDEFQTLVGVDLAPWRDAVAVANPTAFDELVVYQPSFFEGLGALLVEDRLDDWKAWLRAKVVHGLAGYLTDDIIDENF
jgi:putative endopeptidase